MHNICNVQHTNLEEGGKIVMKGGGGKIAPLDLCRKILPVSWQSEVYNKGTNRNLLSTDHVAYLCMHIIIIIVHVHYMYMYGMWWLLKFFWP